MMRRNNKGFSYVEMLMVLAIMAIMIGMVTISIGLIGRNTVSRTSEKLESLVNKARTNALTKGKEKGVLNVAEVNGAVYAYVGERIDDDDTASVKSKGDKVCGSEYEVIIGGSTNPDNEGNKTTSPANGDPKKVLHIGFKQATGGINSAVSDGTIVIVKKKKTTKTRMFQIYDMTGKIR